MLFPLFFCGKKYFEKIFISGPRGPNGNEKLL